MQPHDVCIPPFGLPGGLSVPGNARGLIAFAHGSGSSRFSPRNTAVAEALNERGFATLLFDLLTPQEEQDRANVFDVGLLAGRLVAAVNWLEDQTRAIASLPVGLFGASTGAAAASSRPHVFPIALRPWSRAAGVRIWPARPCCSSGRRPC